MNFNTLTRAILLSESTSSDKPKLSPSRALHKYSQFKLRNTLTPERKTSLEKIIKYGTQASILHAQNNLHGRFPEGEPTILKSKNATKLYGAYLLHDVFKVDTSLLNQLTPDQEETFFSDLIRAKTEDEVKHLIQSYM